LGGLGTFRVEARTRFH